MELRQLKYFEKACELENFSEASRQLYITQSTLSQQIKQLEDELGILLFDRIVHVFYKETRDFYQLERLWADGEHVDIDELIK